MSQVIDEENVPAAINALRRAAAFLQASSDEARDQYTALSISPKDRPALGTIMKNVNAAATRAREAIAMIDQVERLLGQPSRPLKPAA